jgi:hypothetical protein
MLKIDKGAKGFTSLLRRTLTEELIMERGDLQEMILGSPGAFFEELGERLLILGSEVMPSDLVADRVDLLALDPEGATVIIELKRKSHKLQLLQALTYAAMISSWSPERLIAASSRATEDDIRGFLGGDVSNINARQMMVLIAEDYDWEVLATAEWLTERYEMDIRCYRISMSVDGEAQYLTVTSVYPPKELADEAQLRRSSRPLASPSTWTNWTEALGDITNPDVVSFFESEVKGNREPYLPKRMVAYRFNGKKRYDVSARRKAAYVWQHGRFPGDELFWRGKVDSATVAPVNRGTSLRFFLSSRAEFEAFLRAIREELPGKVFLDAGGSGELEVDREME